MQRDSLLTPRRHGCLLGQGAGFHGHQGRVFPVPPVASEEEVTQTSTSRTTCKKLGRGNPGRKACPPNRGNQKTGKPRHAGKGDGIQRQQQQQPRGQQQQQQLDLDHQRVIEKLNLELEVARTNATARTSMSYTNVVKGSPPFTTPPPSRKAPAAASAAAAASASALLLGRP
jgi:hypothetical protein